MRRIIAVIAGILCACTLAAAPAATAQASTRPLPKTQTAGTVTSWGGRGGSWSYDWQTRPSRINFELGPYGPDIFATNLHWQYYTNSSAYATNVHFSEQAGLLSTTATIYLYDVFYRPGPGLNFGYIRVKWVQHGKHYSWLVWINSRGQWMWSGF